jgi:hypothetical protein
VDTGSDGCVHAGAGVSDAGLWRGESQGVERRELFRWVVAPPPGLLGEETQPFASWVIDGNALTVFYALQQNGEQPGRCTAEEHPDSVIVRLTIRAPQGITTTIRGFKGSHATVKLSEPLGDRVVIDAASGDARPRWKGPEPA